MPIFLLTAIATGNENATTEFNPFLIAFQYSFEFLSATLIFLSIFEIFN